MSRDERRRLRILTVAPYTPTPFKARTYHLMKELAARGHRVTVVASESREMPKADGSDLAESGIRLRLHPLTAGRQAVNCIRGLVSRRRPIQAYYSWNRGVLRDAERLASRESFDVVHVAHLRAGLTGLRLQRHPSIRNRVPVMWDAGDCISDLMDQTVRGSSLLHWRWIARLERAGTRRFEKELLTGVSQVTVAAWRDRRCLLRLLSAEARPELEPRVTVVPNGVDLQSFPERPELVRDSGKTGTDKKSSSVVLTGTMDYHPNVAAARRLARDIMPLVWKRRPDVRLLVVGAFPHRTVRRLGRDGGERIQVNGWVPDVSEFLCRSTVAVAPLDCATGTQFKVLEAMATGTVCVTTPAVAGAVGATADRDVVVARSDAEFADGILTVLDRPSMRRSIGRAARSLAKSRFSWQRSADDLEAAYRRSMERTTR